MGELLWWSPLDVTAAARPLLKATRMALDGSSGSARHLTSLATNVAIDALRDTAASTRRTGRRAAEAEPSGRLLEAAARALDNAPTAETVRVGPTLWKALLDGDWSVVEAADWQGRRLLVLRRSHAEPGRRLTEEERRTLELVRKGHANKWLAIELGLAESTISQRVARALAKLRFRSRIEFVRFCGDER